MVRFSPLLDLSQLGVLLLRNMSTTNKESVAVWTKPMSPTARIMDPDLHSLVTGLANGTFSSETLTKGYIARIKQINGFVNAISQVNPDALNDAKQLDKERDAGEIRGGLHGVPILLKETFNTVDKMETTGGSLALKGARPSKEAFVVTALRNAGAVILGKTTITQWSNTRASQAPNGWTSVYGQCHAAFHANQDPQGSSSGAAVAASLNLAAAAIGAETWGSIVYPAQRSSVVGIKPTVGLVSRAGVIPVSAHKDTIGPITRTVRDGALILNILAGHDQDDEATNAIPYQNIPDYTKTCTEDALNGARIAVSESALRTVSDTEVLESFQQALDTMSSMGATVIRDTDFKEFDPEGDQRENLSFNVMLREGIESYFKSLKENPHNVHSLSDLVQFMHDTPEEQVVKYGVEGFVEARDEPYTSESREFKEAVERMKFLGADIERLLDAVEADAIVAPTSADLPFDLGQNPVVTVPLGYFSENRRVAKALDGMIAKANNVPYSLSFVGRKFSEEVLLGLAFAFEQKTQVGMRARPCVSSSVDLNQPYGTGCGTKL